MKNLVLSAALLAALTFAAGCGDGAHEPSNVTLKPSQSAATGGGDNGGTAAPAGNNNASQQAAPAAAQGGYGTVKGKVVLVGQAPDLPPLVAKGAQVKDAEVCAVNAVPNQKFVVGEGNGLANVFIYLVKAPANGKKNAGHEEGDLEFDQKGCTFIPHAMVLRTGVPFTITSADAVTHNVHSHPAKANEVNVVVSEGAAGAKQATYNKAETEPCSVGCDIHTWMLAYHLPLDHPYGVVTDENGEFEIQDLPVGTHKFRIWHEGKLVDSARAITVTKDGATEEVKIELNTALLQ